MSMLKLIARELAGVIVVTLVVTLFVFAMNGVSAPDAAPDALAFGGIAALLLVFVALMALWEPLVQTGRIRVPPAVAIPVGVAAFVVLFVSGLGEVLLHVPELLSPAVALAVAAGILVGATILSLRRDPATRPAPASSQQAVDTQAAIQG